MIPPFGTNIRRIRKTKKKKMNATAATCGMSTGTLHYIETNIQDPKGVQLFRLAEELGVCPSEFFKFSK